MADIENLLAKTSRTFALAIPELPQPTRHEIEVAYLLFRIADTFEDATRWTAAEKIEALRGFDHLLEDHDHESASRLASSWRDGPPVDHEGYVELLGEAPAVLSALETLLPESQAVIRHHLRHTVEGMMRYASCPHPLQLGSVDELRSYCYVVAGIVGEMLTELFIKGWPQLATVGPPLQERARWFGEGLQLTNILKDVDDDAGEGRSYLPTTELRQEIFSYAREDLRLAEEYVRMLEDAGAPKGIVGFTALPVWMAWETLDRVEVHGPGAKLTRPEVLRIVMHVHRALEQGEPVMASVGGDAHD